MVVLPGKPFVLERGRIAGVSPKEITEMDARGTEIVTIHTDAVIVSYARSTPHISAAL
jgi:hypothetical protein